MTLGANDIDLLQKASHYKLEKNVKKRLRKLVEESDSEDKIDTALDYSHSATKSEVRGTR